MFIDIYLFTHVESTNMVYKQTKKPWLIYLVNG